MNTPLDKMPGANSPIKPKEGELIVSRLQNLVRKTLDVSEASSLAVSSYLGSHCDPDQPGIATAAMPQGLLPVLEYLISEIETNVDDTNCRISQLNASSYGG